MNELSALDALDDEFGYDTEAVLEWQPKRPTGETLPMVLLYKGPTSEAVRAVDAAWQRKINALAQSQQRTQASDEDGEPVVLLTMEDQQAWTLERILASTQGWRWTDRTDPVPYAPEEFSLFLQKPAWLWLSDAYAAKIGKVSDFMKSPDVGEPLPDGTVIENSEEGTKAQTPALIENSETAT